ncbi:hypothetical protein [Ruegeria meonggei]|uniref:Uncharacterized protein n=1 Tax=Ruegeria meonggei TaxID=1446476 RepID=A0A1X6YMZ0_9RHOB|nr:hypothetical protein [Ruegeria meonggei]SLN25189.1 hypothetical protein RUM8411_01013 [Ruegeria meonggei]
MEEFTSQELFRKPPTGLEDYFERMRPIVDNTILKLSKAKFREDPIAGRKYSRATSIVSSAYKRHGTLLVQALLERLRDCAHLRVWTEDDFKLSHESLEKTRVVERIEALVNTHLPYGDRQRSIRVDMFVLDEHRNSLNAYSIKRGNGSYDGGKRRSILTELIRTQMLLKSYANSLDIDPVCVNAHIIFYYGVMSLTPPFAIDGGDLDKHFSFPVREAIELVNDYFATMLRNLIEE